MISTTVFASSQTFSFEHEEENLFETLILDKVLLHHALHLAA